MEGSRQQGFNYLRLGFAGERFGELLRQCIPALCLSPGGPILRLLFALLAGLGSGGTAGVSSGTGLFIRLTLLLGGVRPLLGSPGFSLSLGDGLGSGGSGFSSGSFCLLAPPFLSFGFALQPLFLCDAQGLGCCCSFRHLSLLRGGFQGGKDGEGAVNRLLRFILKLLQVVGGVFLQPGDALADGVGRHSWGFPGSHPFGDRVQSGPVFRDAIRFGGGEGV
jgi:hypothetical protein